MFRRNTIAAIVGAALIGGCGPSVKPLAPGSPLSGQRIQVQEFDMTAAQVSSYDEPTNTYGLEVAQKVAEALRGAGANAEAVPRGAPRGTAATVVGQVTKIDGGSRALRYWIGFGAGATQFAVRGRVLRANGQVLGEFADERRSGFGMFGGDTATLTHRCVEEVGSDVANMITTGEYSQ
jgi:hypothetical protein